MTPAITALESTLATPWFIEMTHWRNTPNTLPEKALRRSSAQIGYFCLAPTALIETGVRVALLAPAFMLYVGTRAANKEYAWEHICKPLLDGITLNLFVATISTLSLGFNPFISTINPDEIRRQLSFSNASSP